MESPKKLLQSPRGYLVILILVILSLQNAAGLRYNFGDGSYYVGSVDKGGRPSGLGKYFDSSGTLEYEGEFAAGLRHGQGTLYYRSGSVYHGQFRYGKPDGPGVLKKKNGDQIIGDFRNGRPHGRVVVLMSKSEAHENDHDEGQDHQGHVTRIEGQFKHGMAHGPVTFFMGRGFKSEHQFRMGKPMKSSHDNAGSKKEPSEAPSSMMNLHFKRLSAV